MRGETTPSSIWFENLIPHEQAVTAAIWQDGDAGFVRPPS